MVLLQLESSNWTCYNCRVNLIEGLFQAVFDSIFRVRVEWPARWASYSGLRQGLEASREHILARIGESTIDYSNLEQLRHIIGIEKWGQRRLRVALGEPLLRDNHRDHIPFFLGQSGWVQLITEFKATREETILLLGVLEKARVDSVRIPHNNLGSLSVKGWLRYLLLHAEFESRKLRPIHEPVPNDW